MQGSRDVHARSTTGQIAIPRPKLRLCSASNRVSEVRTRNRDPIFDHLRVEDADGHLIGLLSNRATSDARIDDDARVIEHMDPHLHDYREPAPRVSMRDPSRW